MKETGITIYLHLGDDVTERDGFTDADGKQWPPALDLGGRVTILLSDEPDKILERVNRLEAAVAELVKRTEIWTGRSSFATDCGADFCVLVTDPGSSEDWCHALDQCREAYQGDSPVGDPELHVELADNGTIKVSVERGTDATV